MDYFSKPDTYQIIERLKDKKIELKKQYYKNRNTIIAILVLIIGIISYFVYISNTSFLIIVPLFIGVGLLAVCFVITEVALQSKLGDTYLNKEVMNVYNMEQDENYIYTPKPKLKPEYNKEMGLFTRYASARNLFQITGYIDGVPFDVKSLQLIVSTGNSSQVIFSGFYIILPIAGEKMFQLRTDGKPSLKKTKFKKISTDGKRTFVLEDDTGKVKDKYTRLFDMLEREYDYKKIYIASNEKEIHIGLTPIKKQRFPKNLSGESFNEYYEKFVEIFRVINEIMTKTSEVF